MHQDETAVGASEGLLHEVRFLESILQRCCESMTEAHRGERMQGRDSAQQMVQCLKDEQQLCVDFQFAVREQILTPVQHAVVGHPCCSLGPCSPGR